MFYPRPDFGHPDGCILSALQAEPALIESSTTQVSPVGSTFGVDVQADGIEWVALGRASQDVVDQLDRERRAMKRLGLTHIEGDA